MQKLLCKTCIYSTLNNVALFVDVVCCEGHVTRLNFLNIIVIRWVFFQNDLTFLRVRSKKHEILVAPGKFLCKV